MATFNKGFRGFLKGRGYDTAEGTIFTLIACVILGGLICFSPLPCGGNTR
jgi:hypothetical protein